MQIWSLFFYYDLFLFLIIFLIELYFRLHPSIFYFIFMLDMVHVFLFAIYFFIGTFFSNSIPRHIINQDLVNQEFDFIIVSVFPSMG